MTTQEQQRLNEIQDDVSGWRRWGPYVSERSWASVREDYSADGNAWAYLPHDFARSKAYRWGEDGIAGICDRYQLLCFAPAFWNGKDAILKERLFGLTSEEGNHGEDVKEYYFHLDNTPTHSYMKYVYKYPQGEFPYENLVTVNRGREGKGEEYELLDTGIFDENRYFDISIEYAKTNTEDFCIRIEAINRGPDPAPLYILPHLWFRNTWAWDKNAWTPEGNPEPLISQGPEGPGFISILADDSQVETLKDIPAYYRLGQRILYGPRNGISLFTYNETNGPVIFGKDSLSRKPYTKDAFHRHIVNGENTVNPKHQGTKSTFCYHFPAIAPGETQVLHLRLSDNVTLSRPLADVDSTIKTRKEEADEFYQSIHPPEATADEKMIQRQAFSGLLWTKQNYIFNVNTWLDGDNPDAPPPQSRKTIRNQHWRHLNSLRVLIPCEKWEYPWFAAWDLAFTCPAIARVDPKFAKEQLYFLLFEQFQHPNGQIPAYEWEFSDLNPPVHAWSVWRVYNMERTQTGKADRDFLERCFHKLIINFAWWINKVDSQGNNVFEGGFLGMDNITVVDRSMKMSDGSVLEQSDAGGYMGMFCLNLMRISLELAKENRVYEGLAIKFFQHYAYVAGAMKHMGNRDYQLWDEEDGFFYDVLRFPDGNFKKFRLRSLVGLVPLFAVERIEMEWIKPFKEFSTNFLWFIKNRQDLVKNVVHKTEEDGKVSYALTIVDENQLSRLMHRLYNESEFLSDFGIRSLSKAHAKNPFVYDGISVGYEPAESDSKLKGGNSNWRGPIWFPTSFLLIESIRKLGKAFGPRFAVSTPASHGSSITFQVMAKDLANRLIKIFARNKNGTRPVHGKYKKFQDDPNWNDYILFYEYFNGDTGEGLGAGHQTGWTGLVASLIDEWRK